MRPSKGTEFYGRSAKKTITERWEVRDLLLLLREPMGDSEKKTRHAGGFSQETSVRRSRATKGEAR
jgi:hypothetical protein